MAERGEPLTERELEIVQLAAKGDSNKDIAAALSLSPNTVKVHLRNIFAKLGVESRNELTLIALRNGWVQVNGAPAAAAAGPTGEVAPNPLPMPRLAMWRRAALVLALLAILAGALAALPAGRTAAPTGADVTDLGEVAAGANDLLQPGQSTRWFLRAPLAVPRARAAGVELYGKVYLFGGEVNQAASGDVLVYDPGANAWSELDAQKPLPVWNAAAAALGDEVYVMGGTARNGAATDRVEVMNPANGTWRASAPLPRQLSGQAAAVMTGTLYVFGGRSGGETLSDAYAFDPASGAWRALARMPTPRSLAAATASDGRIYVLGGFDDGRELATCEAYTPADDRWEACRPMTIPRAGHGLVKVGSSLYAVGGGLAGFVGFNERYDPGTDRWTALETPITGDWRNATTVALPTEFYVIGGYSNNRRLPLNYVYEVFNNRTFLPSLSAPKPKP